MGSAGIFPVKNKQRTSAVQRKLGGGTGENEQNQYHCRLLVNRFGILRKSGRVIVARSMSDSFAGIRLADVPRLIAAQFSGATAPTLPFCCLVPITSKDAEIVLVPHD